MPARNEELRGSARDKCETAPLLIDVNNDLDFPEAKQLLRHSLPMAERNLRSHALGKRKKPSP